MNRVFGMISKAYRSICVRLVLGAHRHANACLFIVGVALLCVGLERLSEAEGVRLAEPATPKPAESASASPAESASGRLAPFAVGRPAPFAIGRPAPGAVARLAPGATSRLADAATNRPAEAAQNQPAEAAINQPPQNTDIPYDDTLIRNSVGNLYKFIEGAFGALLVVGAGIGAIIAATLGAYKAALALLVVSVGAFILRAYVSLFFGTNYPDYEVGVGQF